MSEPTREQIDAVLREFPPCPFETDTHVQVMAEEIATLRSRLAEVEREVEYGDAIIDGQARLLTAVVTAIRGEPEPLMLHSHHDAPELVRALVAEADRLRDLCREVGRSGVEGEYRKYLTVQLDRDTYQQCRALDGGDDKNQKEKDVLRD